MVLVDAMAAKARAAKVARDAILGTKKIISIEFHSLLIVSTDLLTLIVKRFTPLVSPFTIAGRGKSAARRRRRGRSMFARVACRRPAAAASRPDQPTSFCIRAHRPGRSAWAGKR
jgi:hypothetical protein